MPRCVPDPPCHRRLRQLRVLGRCFPHCRCCQSFRPRWLRLQPRVAVKAWRRRPGGARQAAAAAERGGLAGLPAVVCRERPRALDEGGHCMSFGTEWPTSTHVSYMARKPNSSVVARVLFDKRCGAVCECECMHSLHRTSQPAKGDCA